MRIIILIAVLCLTAPAYACEEVREYAKAHGVKCWGGNVGTCTTMIFPGGYYDEDGNWVPISSENQPENGGRSKGVRHSPVIIRELLCTYLYQCEDGKEIECKDLSIWSY